MMDAGTLSSTDFVLPPSLVTKIDVSRLVNELEAIDNAMTTVAVRTKVGVQQQSVPSLSPQLTTFIEQNKLDLQNSNTRTEIIKQLRTMKDTIPVIHMTFSSQADTESLQQLVQWLRTSVHPQAVVSVGLQPGLIAGVYIRTPNRVHDLSMRAKLQASRGLLAKELEALRGSR